MCPIMFLYVSFAQKGKCVMETDLCRCWLSKKKKKNQEAAKQLSTLNWEDLLLLLVSVVVSCYTTVEAKGKTGDPNVLFKDRPL